MPGGGAAPNRGSKAANLGNTGGKKGRSGGARPNSGPPKGKSRWVHRAEDKFNLAKLAKEHTQTAIDTLVEICKDRTKSEAARVTAANSLLDRGWGRPMQSIQHEAKDGAPLVTFLESLKDDEDEPKALPAPSPKELPN